MASDKEQKHYTNRPEYIVEIVGGELDGHEYGANKGATINDLVDHVVKESLFKQKRTMDES